MQATDDLRAEHRGVLRMCAIMEGVASRVVTGPAPPAEDLARIVEFLSVFVDRCHHTKEETLLFPHLAERADQPADSLIADLLAEHDQGRRQVAGFASASAGQHPLGPELAWGLKGYVDLLTRHIATEEEKLFPLADAMLPSAEQARLAQEYERVEEEVVGAGRHEAFHAMLARLEAVYPAHL